SRGVMLNPEQEIGGDEHRSQRLFDTVLEVPLLASTTVKSHQRIEVRVVDGPAKGAAAQSGEDASRARLLVLCSGRMADKKSGAAGSVSRSCDIVRSADDDARHLRRREILGDLEALGPLAIESQVELGGQP